MYYLEFWNEIGVPIGIFSVYPNQSGTPPESGYLRMVCLLFISYNLEIVEIGIFLNIYSAIFGELFQTQLSLCVYSKLLEQYILERVTFV